MVYGTKLSNDPATKNSYKLIIKKFIRQRFYIAYVLYSKETKNKIPKSYLEMEM